MEHFADKESEYFLKGKELLIHRCEKCVEIKGDHIEKKQICFISVTLKSWSRRKLLDPTTYVFQLLSALFSNIMDTIKTMKVLYIQTLRQFYGMTVTV